MNDAAKYTIFEQPEIEDTSREIVKYILISKTICTFTIWIEVREVIVFIHLKGEVNTLIGESLWILEPILRHRLERWRPVFDSAFLKPQ